MLKVHGQAVLFHLGALPSPPPLTLYGEDRSLMIGLVQMPWHILHIAGIYSGEGYPEGQVYCCELASGSD